MAKQKKTRSGASPASAQHLAARLAQARNKKQVKRMYGKALR